MCEYLSQECYAMPRLELEPEISKPPADNELYVTYSMGAIGDSPTILLHINMPLKLFS